MRKKIVAGNWKMNNNSNESKKLIEQVIEKMPKTDVEVIIAPSFVNLQKAVEQTKDSKIQVAAQNMHFAENGAFTGEISAQMLTSIGVETVILGHSERREYFNETDEALAKKVDTALKHKIKVIFCVGEKLEQRKAEKHFEVVKNQLEKGLFNIKAEDWKNIIVAYEPVWAIGTGETASPEQAQEIHAFIRKAIEKKIGKEIAQIVPILYGGSCKPTNAKELFSKEDIDGGLIGGSALKADDFIGIVKAF